MDRIGPLWIQLYRQTPGDLGIKDISVPGYDLDDAKERTRNCLKNWFENHEPNPHHARLVDAGGVMIAMYLVNLCREVELAGEEMGSA